jgi:hypothetical protein
MADLTAAAPLNQVGQYLAEMDVPVDGAAVAWYESSMVCALSATGLAVKAGTASTGQVLGVSTQDIDNSAGADSAVSVRLVQGLFWMKNTSGNTLTQAHMFGPCYAEDDQTVSNSSGDGPLAGIALALDTRRGVLVMINGAQNYPASQATLESDLASIVNGEGASKIGVEDAAGNFGTANVEAVLAEIISDYAAVTNGNGASKIGIEDSGGFTTATDVEAALAEVYTDMTTAQAFYPIPLSSFFDADGDPLVKFIDGASAVPGLNLADSEAFGMRWNNNGTHDPILTSFPLPPDLDATADVILHIRASKTGNTLADATTFAVTAFNQTNAALHDADADFGGTTSAMTGDAAAKTVQEVTLTLANANIAADSTVTMTIDPTSAVLTTDDVIILGVWLEYTRAILTS